jgi:hypothetical protein
VGAEKRLCVQDDTQTERGHADVFDTLNAIRRYSSSIKAWFDSWLGQRCSRTDYIQTGSVIHSASNLMGTGGTFLGVKLSECEASHLFPSGAEVNKCVRSDINTCFISQEEGNRYFRTPWCGHPIGSLISYHTFYHEQSQRRRKTMKNKNKFLKKRESIFLGPN